MSTLYKRRVLVRMAKLIRKHGIKNHVEASSHGAFAKEFRKRKDCWEHLFNTAIAFLRSNKSDVQELEMDTIKLTSSITTTQSRSQRRLCPNFNLDSIPVPQTKMQ